MCFERQSGWWENPDRCWEKVQKWCVVQSWGWGWGWEAKPAEAKHLVMRLEVRLVMMGGAGPLE